MSDTINTLVVSGRVTADAEVTELRSGNEVLKFGLAVNKRVRRGDEWENEPMFFDIETFDRYCVKMAAQIVKGRKVTVHGKLDYRAWETEDGSKRSRVTIKAEDIELGSLPKGKDGEEQPAKAERDPYDEDVPF